MGTTFYVYGAKQKLLSKGQEEASSSFTPRGLRVYPSSDAARGETSESMRESESLRSKSSTAAMYYILDVAVCICGEVKE